MNKMIVLCFLIMFVIGTDTFVISPLIPTLQNEFHISTELSGWMIGAYTLGSALFALIAGPLSDGWDRRKVLLTGLVCFAASTFLCGFASGFWTMCLLRFLAGVSAAFTAPQVWAAIPALVPSAKIPKAMGIAYAGLAVSQALGVPIGSLLAASNWSYPFLAIGLCAFLLATVAWFAVPAMKPNAAKGAAATIAGKYAALLASGKARTTFLAYFSIHFGCGAAFAFFGKWTADRFHLPVDQVGLCIVFMGLGNLLGSLLSANTVRLLGGFRTIAGGFAIMIVLYAALPYQSSVIAATAVYFLIFTALGILFPILIAMLNALNPAIRGTISSLATSTMNGATTLASWAAGLCYALLGGYTAVALMTAICLGASLATLIWSGAMKREERAAART